MSAHTPGPLFARCINDNARPYAVITPNGFFGDEIVAGYLSKEDAVLYAAAPDMLAALKRAEEHFRMLPRDMDQPGSVMEAMASAIAKAGEP